ncbi:HAMP domain-containing histidine kinase [Fibrella sp. HMF5335]|uniref:histidine kinase n=1 Tax=Fibrella rubiginis TaxID=2817060 RepID=A0A939GJH3_9BACT|nr:HAMP domain-containing sensor histidine kinase [Fibrella rubiginis]MBO0938585.1 HAMP domain-containing histidine kinase [Fibrella rubiginis]
MKLLHKWLIYLLLVAVPVAVGGVWVLQRLIRDNIRTEVDEQLRTDLLLVTQQAGKPGFAAQSLNNIRVAITPETGPQAATNQPVFTDTVAYDPREREFEPIRRITATLPATTGQYRVTISQPMGEFNEIIQLLSVSVTVTFVVLLGLLLLLNGWLLRRLWQPFYQLTDQLRAYRLDPKPANGQPVAPFADSDVTEFRQLSGALNEMSRNLHSQFMAQRQFTDNAAHEMQTPLTIAGHELDRLLGTEPLSAEQIETIGRAQEGLERLVRLNKSLLLLTRIDSHQFADEPVDLSTLIGRLVTVYADFAEHHDLGWAYTETPDVMKRMNPFLAEVLFSNLLQNAVRHSAPYTTVQIRLLPDEFMIQNTAPPLPFAPDQLFERFVKNPAHPESTGLGLSLVQQIAQLYGLKIRYSYADGQHCFSVTL